MQLQTTMKLLSSVFFDSFFSFFALFFRAHEGWVANRVTQTKNVSAEVAKKKKSCAVSVGNIEIYIHSVFYNLQRKDGLQSHLRANT